MLRRLRPTPPDDATDGASPERDDPAVDDAIPAVALGEPGLAALPVVGFTRRRAAAVVTGVLAAWIVIVFVRQVSEASAATARADDIAAGNLGLSSEVASLERELDLIARERYIAQQARGYGLGSSREVPFTLAEDAPPLPPDAPGSAALRVGAASAKMTPLERWLTVLFGPAD